MLINKVFLSLKRSFKPSFTKFISIAYKQAGESYQKNPCTPKF